MYPVCTELAGHLTRRSPGDVLIRLAILASLAANLTRSPRHSPGEATILSGLCGSVAASLDELHR